MYCLTELFVSLWYVMCIQVCGAITSALNEARLQIAMSDRRQSFVSHRVSLHTQKYRLSLTNISGLKNCRLFAALLSKLI